MNIYGIVIKIATIRFIKLNKIFEKKLLRVKVIPQKMKLFYDRP